MIRSALQQDLAPVELFHAGVVRADGWRRRGYAFVAEIDGAVVAYGLRCPSEYHPTRDLFSLTVEHSSRRRGIGTRVLRALLECDSMPLSHKLYDDNDAEQRFLKAFDVRAYQHCPPGVVDPGLASVQQWATVARQASSASVQDCVGIPTSVLAQAFAAQYQWQHAAWSPTDPAKMAQLGAEFADELRCESSHVVLDGESLVAICGVFETTSGPFADGPVAVVCCEAIDPAHPGARDAVTATLAQTILSWNEPTPLLVERHASDPHITAIVDAIPNVTGYSMHLVEIR